MSRYKLTEEIKQEYIPIIREFLDKVNNVTDTEIENMVEDKFELPLSNTKLNPYTLQKLLEEEFGYEDDEIDTNGWQMDFWITLTKSGEARTNIIQIAGTGITFELNLRVNIG